MIKNRVFSLQKYLWLDQKLTPESPKYNIGGYAVIKGNVDCYLFKKAISAFADKHVILKSFFREAEGIPFSLVNEKPFEEDIHCFEKNGVKEAIHLIQKDFKQSFNVSTEKRLFRIWLIKTSPNTFIWYTKLHHLIADGYSFQLLFNGVSSNYKALTGETILQNDSKPKEFRQCVKEEEEYYKSKGYLNDQEYWKNKYTTFPELIFNQQHQENKFYDKEIYLPEEYLQKIQLLSKEERVSVFHILLASFSIVLSKFYYTEEINIGTPILNRLSRSDRKVFGPFINLLPLQIQLREDISFLEFVKQIKSEAFSMLRHQKFQQAEILKALSYEGNRLYDVRVSYESFDYQKTFSDFEAEIIALSNYSEEDPISVHIMDYNTEGLKFRFDINGSHVEEYIADEFIKSLEYILKNTTTLLEEKLKDITITTSEQIEEVKSISVGKISTRKNRSFPELWKENNNQFSSNKALIYNDQELSYNEVDKKITSISNYLQEYGIKKGNRVGVLLDRSINIIPTILGILQSGATYVPIDKTFPDERKKFIIEDSDIKLLLTDNPTVQCSCDAVLIQTILENKTPKISNEITILPEDEAYIIYTSGSTGKPKGVSITHESLIDYTTTFSEYFTLNVSDCVIQQSAFVFDTSIEEIFPILSVGGTLVISKKPKDFHKLVQECSTHKVTLLSTNPFVVNYLNDHLKNYTLSLKTLISGGDVLKREQVLNLLDTVNVYNTYGPTESTVCATYHKVAKEDNILPIGKPISNRKVFIVKNNQLLPKGTLGEIVLGGKGLSNHYINNEVLTKSLFVEINGERVYKTGDLGQWNQHGELIFYGRKDTQLSFRGYRIEASEIEQTIKSIDASINNCHVTIKELQSLPSLIAYVSSNNRLDNNYLLIEIKKKLPSYMIPNHIVVLDKLPLNTSGKVDIEKLPLPKNTAENKEIILPSTALEKEIADIWKELLNINKIGIHTKFFELGGHSLLANQFIGTIREKRNQDISLKEFYEAPTIHEIVKVIKSKEVSYEFQLQKAPEQELYPLSYPQERLWFLDQLNQENKSYYVPRAIKMTGKLDINRIRRAFTLLTEKHEVLRTVFPVIDGVPYQKILEPFEFQVPLISLEHLVPEEQDEALKDFIFEEGNTFFDLENGPLLRITILKRSEEDQVLVLCEHHLIHDGWTQGILLREYINIYTELMQDENYRVTIPELQFKDFSYWQKGFFDDQRLTKHMAFWKQKLEGHIPVLPLPQKAKRPKLITGNGKLLIKTINAELSDKIRDYSINNGATLFITMMTAFKLTLSRFSNETDICVGTAVANRRLISIKNILGMVINTITLRTKFEDSDTFTDALEKVKETCFEAYTYEDTPFGKVVEHVAPKRSLGIMPLFQYIFSFMNTPSRNLFLPDMDLEILDSHNLSAKFDINVVVVTPYEQALLEGMEETDRTIIVEWEYNSDIYAENTMWQMLDSYFEILEALVTTPKISYKQLPCMTQEQEKELLIDFNNTAKPIQDHTIIDLFKMQVKKNPDTIAVVYEDRKITYRELDEYSNELANFVLSQGTVEKENIIGILLDRSERIVISMLAVLKAGCAYVSIDQSFPDKRIEYIIEDSNCQIVIDEKYLKKFQSSKKDATVLKNEINSTQLAYIIYTSGSTGQPKGVMIEHKNLVNFLDDYQLEISNTTLTCKTIFDVSVFEIMGSLTSGSTLFIPNEEVVYNPKEYADYLFENKISHCYIHPMHLKEISNQLATYDEVYLKKILIGVEGIQPTAIEWYHKNKVEIVNAYGPTESTICATNMKVDSIKAIKTPYIPIGTPLSNYQIYILDSYNHTLQPKGVIGELCISGAGLSRGYLHQPELTAEKFISHPFRKGERLYKTGDLARWLPDGNLEFLGRKDTQVKLRGYRIELGEIEYALNQQTDVDATVVVVQEEGQDKYLVAYLVTESAIDSTNLKETLRSYLPEYMIPQYFMKLEALPLTSNGKIDRKALPKVSIEGLGEREYIAPSTETERKLAEIWQEVLGVDKVGITDNFFELGGHSLKITQLINKINKELQSSLTVQQVFVSPTIKGLSKEITTTNYKSIPKAPVQELYPLTSSQGRLWVLSQFEGGGQAYNIPGVLKMEGSLDATALELSFRYLIERHDSLRMYFVEKDGEVYQKILSAKGLNFTLDKQQINQEELEAKIASFYQEEFDLSKAPLLSARLLEVSKDQYYLLFAIHHIIGDGWSMEVLTKELMQVYKQLINQEEVTLSKLTIQYQDYVVWSQSKEQQAAIQKQEDYWLEKFTGELPVLALPSYQRRPLVKTYNGSTKHYSFGKELSEKLNQFSKAQGATLYMTLLAGVNGLLYRYTNQSDIIIGAPIAGRSHEALEHQVGLYLNTLAIRTRFEGNNSFKELVETQKETLVEAYTNQDYPFDSLIEKLKLKRDTSRSALFDVMVVLQNQRETAVALEGLHITPYSDIERDVSKFDISFSFTEDTEGIHLRLEYNNDIYDAQLIDQLYHHLEQFITSALEHQEESIQSLTILSQEEETQLLATFNDTKVVYPKDNTVIDLFREQVAKTPEATAIIDDTEILTYQELEDLSNAMANDLLSNTTIENESLIGVALERSEWLIVSLLAILKTGGAYVPIDPTYPQQRKDYIKHDSQCILTITEEYLNEFKTKEKDTRIPKVAISSDQLAYVIYTSGSTGHPKGVLIEHKSVTSLIQWSKNTFDAKEVDIIYFTTSYSFDLSVYEVFYSLCSGKKVRVLEDATQIPKYLKEDSNVLINTVPSVVHSLISQNIDLNVVQVLNMAGEIIPPKFTKELPLSKMDVYNLYGPSEDTTYSTYFKLQETSKESISIGVPIANTQVFILSENQALQPIGVTGELCISGAGLSRGYLHQPELTAEKFIAHPYKSGERLYKTGDLARWLPNGNLDFLGRKDTQVKLRGYRIELGEIEHKLTQVSGISEALVDVIDYQNDRYLTALVVSKLDINKENLKASLRSELPEYMVPNFFQRVDKLPLTPNGKVDRKAVALTVDKFTSQEYVAPRNKTEETLVAIWEDILKVENIGIQDDFFELGGHSLKVIAIRNRIKQEFDIELQVKMFFNKPTIQSISEVIKVISLNVNNSENYEEITI
ncbi:tyrocidine synthase 3 [Kordia sp. SMS9]|uniref:non-ribosomal peptide synthetase n=1 Tax=Kordia sp. SMS9 TaxID=2282170 RepID=UPI000E0D7B93|nr:non-ribosomal peptide synthetase [Kordia sp. SMS9]AXG70213.1 tyrocidine synthase 3 [Kordia sp. SMS9]